MCLCTAVVFSGSGKVILPPPGTFDNVWRCFLVVATGGATGGWWVEAGTLLKILQCTGQPLQPRMTQPQISIGQKLGNPQVEESFIKLGSYSCIIHLVYFPVFPLKAIIQVQDCVAALDPGISFSGFNKVEKKSFRCLSFWTPEVGAMHPCHGGFCKRQKSLSNGKWSVII